MPFQKAKVKPYPHPFTTPPPSLPLPIGAPNCILPWANFARLIKLLHDPEDLPSLPTA